MKFKILIFTCFLSLVLSNTSSPGIFGGDDHDKVANQISSLISKLHKKSLNELRDYALSLESYRSNGQIVFGGLHDYINEYNEQSLIEYIISVCIEKKELLDEQKFKDVVTQFASSSNNDPEKSTLASDSNQNKNEKQTSSVGENIFEDFLLIQSRDKLIEWALTCEYHAHLIKHEPLVGGLFEYVDSLSDREIVDFIMNLVEMYPELGSKESLEQLSNQYDIKYESKGEDENPDDSKDVIEKPSKSLNFLADPEPEGEGGLVDFIFRLPIERLYQYALTAEKYQHEAIGQHIRGGIADYIDELNKTQIAWFVLDIAKQFPELNSKEFMDSLVSKYGF